MGDLFKLVEEFYNKQTPLPDTMWMSLDAAAHIGIDISQAPIGSICELTKDGVRFILTED